MKTANKKQRERLLELNRRLAEDDKNGVMAYKVLQLFWTLAHSPDIPPEVLDQALASHVKILDYSCSQERDAQKTVWLDKCVEELRAGDNWVLPALKLIREICCLYEATPQHAPRVHAHPVLNRQQVIDRLQTEHTLVILVTQSLTSYMDKVRAIVKEQPNVRPMELMLDKRYPHPQQIQERLEFLKFLLKDGQLWLCADQAKQIWQCLAVNAAFASDREECFRWFGKLMGDEPDLDPGINKDFFENNLLQLDPVLLTESGIKCFERFFKAVNSKEEKLKAKNRGYVLDDEDLIGKDYLWRVITTGGEDIANKAIELLKEVSTALGPRLQAKIEEFHENFIGECCERLKTLMGNIIVLTKIVEEQSSNKEQTNETKEIHMHRLNEAEKMCRIVRVLQEYIKECDRAFYGDRYFLPLSRASRGKHIVLYVRFQTPGKALDDIEITTHSNEMVISFKRNLLKRIKATPFNNIKVDLYNSNGELIEVSDERNPLIQYNIRDKTMINAKLTPMGTGMTSSPETSSDSSTGSPPRPCPDMQRQESEGNLPGLIITHKQIYIDLFLKIYQMGSELEHNALRDTSRALLHLLPLDRHTIRQIHEMCQRKGSTDETSSSPTPEDLFLSTDASKVLYNLEVLHALLIPALDPLSELTQQLQLAWLHSGVAHFVLDLLTKNNFLSNADAYTRRAAFQCVLKLVKLFLYIVGCVLSRVGDEPSTSSQSDGCRLHVDMLKHALTTIPGSSEYTLRTIASKMAANLAEEMLSAGDEGDRCRSLFQSALQWSLPDTATIKAIVQLAWATANGNLQLTGKQEIRPCHTPDQFDLQVCREALEVLSISLVLNSSANEALIKDPMWSTFITSLLIMNPSRHVRQAVAEQLLVSCTYCAADKQPFVFLAKLLVTSLHTLVPQHSATCAEFFQLLCRTINYGCVYNWSLALNENLLSQEIAWLHTIRENVKTTGELQVHEDLLAGHLCLAKELLVFLNPELKGQLNSLILEFIDDFLFPASRQYLQMRRSGSLVDCKGPPPVCRTPHTIAAACDLLVALCQHCVPNMKLLVATLIEMFSADTEPLKEWEYLPPVGPRPNRGFVGLKNAGATCYMNSVLQQLFMVQSIRVGILSASGACLDPNEDFTGESEPVKSDNDRFFMTPEKNNTRKNYHVGILKYVQAIFAHLGHSSLQYYIPRGLWAHFKLQGEPVNLREQQDAVEFFMSLFESLDEGLKALGHPQLMGATLGGSFSDQKICQGCPHRYSKDEPFSVFSVDIRNHSSLTDSLEQYVKGELLEGADAYHCDKCDKKVVTVKRLCVRKLPPVLAIQLKRFEYDYERVCAIKFNDYFEFPRKLDMEPYTVSGLAKIEGEVIDIEDNMFEEPATTKYQLTGIVVHSGQASGGHYFSFILHKNPNGTEQWYKFDDGEVSECKMHEDEELKAQCFGGDYMGEVYDNNLKRMQYRRQKRWWNAYMLFYTRCDQQPIQFNNSIEQLCLAESKDCVLPMPEPIEKSVRTQNIKFLHARSMFSVEFFSFIRKIVSNTAPPPRSDKLPQQVEELSLLGIQLASQFLFHSGLRTKKTLRGPAIDWYDVLCQHIRGSSNVRRWFAANVLLNPPSRLAEYILIAPSPEVRTVFVKLVVFFCHFAITDEPLPNYDGTNLCEQVLIAVLSLLKSEVAEHGKHLPHYFSLFCMYAGLGIQEKHQLLKLNVPAIFMQVALEEGPGPSIKYQYPDISKLHQVVSNLVRSSDVSGRCQSSNQSPVRPNIFAQPNVPPDSFLPLSQEAQELLFNRTGYVKKLIEDTNVGDDGVKLLQYCSWENPHFSRNLLTELLWHCGFAYWHDMRHHTELLLSILLIEDSWQHHRIHNAIMGISEDREGLLDTILRNKNNYQKRAYQCIKCMVQLFTRSQVALTMLNTNSMLARQWAQSVEWLQDELDRQRTIGGQYNYSSWSPPAQSNESTNSFILERSLSAKNVLRRALELCPEEEPDEQNDLEVDPIDENVGIEQDQDDDQQVPIASISSMVDKSGAQFSAAPPSSPMHQANTTSSSSLTETEIGDNVPKIVGSISKTSLNQLSSSADNTSTSDTGTTQIHNTSTETNSVSPVSMEQDNTSLSETSGIIQNTSIETNSPNKTEKSSTADTRTQYHGKTTEKGHKEIKMIEKMVENFYKQNRLEKTIVDKSGAQFSAAPPSSPMHQANTTSSSSLTETEIGDNVPKIVGSISKTSLNQLSSSADNTSTSDTGTTQIHNTSTETNSVSPVSMEQDNTSLSETSGIIQNTSIETNSPNKTEKSATADTRTQYHGKTTEKGHKEIKMIEKMVENFYKQNRLEKTSTTDQPK
uniref:ubiquitinyl hydrolase 1 n=1 Tax=Culicoides sonorensis TaxID=179676 RepID=A0A336MFC5_CULSO